MRRTVGSVLLVFVACWWFACTAPTPAQQTGEVVEALCNCEEPGDSGCIAQATTAVGSASEMCIECVSENEQACAAMINDCIPICITQQQP